MAELEQIRDQSQNLVDILKSPIFALMKELRILRALLPSVLVDYFELTNIEETPTRYDLWLEEKAMLSKEDRRNSSIVSNGFSDYRTIQDFPIRGRATYLHLRKRKWLDKDTGEIFSYDYDVAQEGTRLTEEFVSFLKGED